ncbi:MAG: hypothetical protein KGV57_00585 [Fusobacterium sp.]|nr:hypothetical protein [Fusobacterium sp.]
MKKYLIIIVLMFLTGCTIRNYAYYPKDYRNEKIFIKGHLLEEFDDENSPLDNIWIFERGSNSDSKKVKILSSMVKLTSEGKEYIVHTNPNSNFIHVYKQGIIITGDFTAYIGNVQLSNGETINIPPMKFKRNVLVESYNGVMDALDKGDRRTIFSGTVEEYKKRNK